MSDVDRDLETLRMLRDHPPVDPESLASVRWRADRATMRRRIGASAVAAAAVIALVVGAVVVVQRSNDSGPSVVAGGDNEPGRGSALEDSETLFLVPTFVPEGFELIRASGGDTPAQSVGGGGTGADWQQHYVRFDPAGERPLEILDVQWATTTPGLLDDPGGIPPAAARLTVRGRDGYYDAEYGTIGWQEPDGQLVFVQGTLARDGPGDLGFTSLPVEFLQTVAEALVPRDGGGFDLPSPPGGFELVAEAPGEYSEGTNQRILTYRGPDGRGFELQLVDDNERPPGMRLYTAADRIVDVRGREGVLTTSDGMVAGGGTYDEETRFISERTNRTLTWVERSNVAVTINGVELTESELLEIAESLERVPAETWFALQREDADEPAPERNDVSEIDVLVLNAGQPSGSGTNLTNQLRASGYRILLPGNAPPRTGTSVQCRSASQDAAADLALAVSSTYPAVEVEPFEDPAGLGAGAELADCIVYLGAP